MFTTWQHGGMRIAIALSGGQPEGRAADWYVPHEMKRQPRGRHLLEEASMELQIEGRNVDMTPAWKTEIEDRKSKLHTGHDDLIHGRMTLTKNLHHHKAQDGAEALIVVSLSDRHTLTARKAETTFEEAIRAAFAALQVEIRKYRDRRGSKEIRGSSPPLLGVISKLFPQEGYGFILQEGGGGGLRLSLPPKSRFQQPLSNRPNMIREPRRHRGTAMPHAA